MRQTAALSLSRALARDPVEESPLDMVSTRHRRVIDAVNFIGRSNSDRDIRCVALNRSDKMHSLEGDS
jgi:hypothetical protein